MNFTGIILGACVFLIIGVCHPIVIKLEYHLGKSSWWILAVVGLAFCILSVMLKDSLWSTIAGAAAFSCFWGIYETFEQEKRVLKGWFPMNPKRADYYKTLKEKEGKRDGRK